MKLVLNTRGTFLSKRGDCFIVKIGGINQEIPSKKVEQIMVTSAVTITTDALKLAIDSNIDVVFLDNYGDPFGRLWTSKLGSITSIRRKQLYLDNSILGLEIVQGLLKDKIEHQVKHLKKLAENRRDERKDMLLDSVSKMRANLASILALTGVFSDELRLSIQGYEGSASKVYFRAISEALPEKYQFQGRSRKPALDEFNCLLNYGYGILYSSVEKACILAGLDPYIGIMHTDNYNKKSLTFDLIESYRGYIDELVVRLITTKKVKDVYFDKQETSVYLNKEGKQLIIGAYNDWLQTTEKHRGKNMKMEYIIQHDCHELANKLLE